MSKRNLPGRRKPAITFAEVKVGRARRTTKNHHMRRFRAVTKDPNIDQHAILFRSTALDPHVT
jgi:hypothetical protein